jgi:hypothetical protein
VRHPHSGVSQGAEDLEIKSVAWLYFPLTDVRGSESAFVKPDLCM